MLLKLATGANGKGSLSYKGEDIAVFIPNSCGEVLLMHLEELILKAWTKPINTVDRHRAEIAVRDYVMFIRRRYAGVMFTKDGLDKALRED